MSMERPCGKTRRPVGASASRPGPKPGAANAQTESLPLAPQKIDREALLDYAGVRFLASRPGRVRSRLLSSVPRPVFPSSPATCRKYQLRGKGLSRGGFQTERMRSGRSNTITVLHPSAAFRGMPLAEKGVRGKGRQPLSPPQR
jgi:hypothetical protein